MYEAATIPPLPTRDKSALLVQQNVNDALVGVSEQMRALRIRMRAEELSPTSLDAAACADRTRSRLGDIEHEIGRMRGALEAIEWRIAL